MVQDNISLALTECPAVRWAIMKIRVPHDIYMQAYVHILKCYPQYRFFDTDSKWPIIKMILGLAIQKSTLFQTVRDMIFIFLSRRTELTVAIVHIMPSSNNLFWCELLLVILVRSWKVSRDRGPTPQRVGWTVTGPSLVGRLHGLGFC